MKNRQTTPRSAYWKQIEHLQKTWRSSKAFGIERLVRVVLCALSLALPVTLVREVSGRFGLRSRKVAIEVYALSKPAILGIVLWTAPTATGAKWLALVCLGELYAYLLGLLLLSDIYAPPASTRRSFILLAPNFAEHILGFALLYASWGSVGAVGGQAVKSPDGLVFFSMVTSATVGFGDLVPLDSRTRWLVVVQMAASILFLSVLLTTATSNLGRKSDAPTG